MRSFWSMLGHRRLWFCVSNCIAFENIPEDLPTTAIDDWLNGPEWTFCTICFFVNVQVFNALAAKRREVWKLRELSWFGFYSSFIHWLAPLARHGLAWLSSMVSMDVEGAMEFSATAVEHHWLLWRWCSWSARGSWSFESMAWCDIYKCRMDGQKQGSKTKLSSIFFHLFVYGLFWAVILLANLVAVPAMFFSRRSFQPPASWGWSLHHESSSNCRSCSQGNQKAWFPKGLKRCPIAVLKTSHESGTFWHAFW